MTTTTERTAGQGWTVDDSTLGARLALVRQRMDWNIKEAAIECGIPPASWKNWERGTSEPRRLLETCKLISIRTGCDFMWLVAGGAAATLRESKPRRRDRRNTVTHDVLAANTRPGFSRASSGRPPSYPPARRHPIIPAATAA